MALVGCQRDERRLDERLEPTGKREFERRRAEIESEIAGIPAHPWAGAYFEGDGLGANVHLYLAPEGGVAAIWTGCMGVYDRNWGTVDEEGGILELRFELENDSDGVGVPEEVVLVPWDERRYLIEPDDFAYFG